MAMAWANRAPLSRGKLTAQRSIDLVKYRQDPCQQHHDHNQHQNQQYRGIQQRTADLPVQPVPLLIIDCQRVERLLRAAGALTYRHKSGHIGRKQSLAFQGLSQRDAVIHLVSHRLQLFPPPCPRSLFCQQRQTITGTDPRMEQQCQLPAQRGNFQIGRLFFLHIAPRKNGLADKLQAHFKATFPIRKGKNQ